MPLSNRQMQPGDIPAVLAVRFSTKENAITLEELEEDYGITPQSIAHSLTVQTRGWLCEDDGNVVGVAMGNGSNGEIEVVAVLPDYEGQGVGGSLLKLAQDWLFSLGHKEIWLLANPDPDVRATGFYEHFGWQATGVMEDDDQVLTLQRTPPEQPLPTK